MTLSKRFWGARIIAVLFALALVATGVTIQPVEAHQPHFNADGTPNPAHPYVLRRLDVSQVVYGTLARPGRVDYYQMAVPGGFSADVQIVVPAVSACASFRPVLAIAGPGLTGGASATPVIAGTPVAEATPVVAGTPLAIPTGGQQWLVVRQDHWGTFFEPFSRTTYATGPHIKRDLAGGTYLLAVFSPDGHVGTYGLSLGGSEQPGGDPQFRDKIGPINRCEVPR